MARSPGLGLPKPEKTRGWLEHFILYILAAVRYQQRLVAWWNVSQTYQVPKGEAPRTRCMRLLHGLCTFGKMWVGPGWHEVAARAA